MYRQSTKVLELIVDYAMVNPSPYPALLRSTCAYQHVEAACKANEPVAVRLVYAQLNVDWTFIKRTLPRPVDLASWRRRHLPHFKYADCR